MALPPHLPAELRLALRQLRAAYGAASVPTAAGKALETWVALRLATAAQASGLWLASLRQGDGTPLPAGRPFLLPRSQAGIRPANANGPGYVLLQSLGPARAELELHLDLQWKGRSDATHECDVSVVPKDIAEPLRRSRGGHPRGLPIAAYECKDRTREAVTDEMRQTLARLYDLTLVTSPYPGWKCRIFEATTGTRWGRWSSTYRASLGSGAFGVVRVGAFGPGAQALGAHYHIGRHDHVYQQPNSIDEVERGLTRVLRDIDLIM